MNGVPAIAEAVLPQRLAALIIDHFSRYQLEFKELTALAAHNFQSRDWHRARRHASARLRLYKQTVRRCENCLRRETGPERDRHEKRWRSVKRCYARQIVARDDWELAETFFNSVTRRLFGTVGTNPDIEFISSHFSQPPSPATAPVYRTYRPGGDLPGAIRTILTDCRLQVEFADLPGDAQAVAEHIRLLPAVGSDRRIRRIDVVKNLLYRGKGAYCLGRLYTDQEMIPFVMALLHPADGIRVDAVLLDEDSVSILFSFTRAYFQVRCDRPFDLVRFVKSMIPRKRVAEIYTAIGYHKHGKTELYRDMLQYTRQCGPERFEKSRGKPGLVMIVFNMPGDDLVFKLIRDRFQDPKQTTRREVLEKYELVFEHDRAGRLVEAHSFELLDFQRCWFAESLLAELIEEASGSVHAFEDRLIFDQAFVERRVTPLDVFLQAADRGQAEAAVIDFGNAIKDLAVSDIFPGDMLLKNFGVTRHGRVVFYDYDELCSLTECNFRKMPPPPGDAFELNDETWFHVDENDVFPEEFARFLGLPPTMMAVFRQHHGDLFDIDFWQKAQQDIRSGRLTDILPYRPDQRLVSRKR